jgi:hypothetical protein
LPDDGLDKIVYVDGGVYDIFEEIGGTEYAQSIPESSEDLWRQYNTIIPSNTKIIGIGEVIFNSYINGLIKIQNETSEKPNAFDLSLFNCGEKEVVIECATNIYIPKIYKSN